MQHVRKIFKTLLLSALLVLLSAAIVMSPSLVGPADASIGVDSNGGTVYIPDQNLEAAVRSALDKPMGDITVADMKEMNILFAPYRDIRDLTGLEHAVNMNIVYLYSNQITDLSPLSGLTNLGRLDLFSNMITDLSPLSDLINLEYLELSSNQITDLSPLSDLINLEYLELSSNQITDLSPLSGLTDLEYLDLSSNQITDPAPLSGITNLRYLHLESNQLTDVSALSSLTDLGILYIGSSQLTGISFLSSLTNLSCLSLTLLPDQLTDISVLSGLVNLSTLNLGWNRLSDIDISPLNGLVNLNVLHLCNNRLSQAPDFTGFTELWELTLQNNQLEDIANLFLLEDMCVDIRYNDLNTDAGSQLMDLIEHSRENRLRLTWCPQTTARGNIMGLLQDSRTGEPVRASVRVSKNIDEYNSVYEGVYSVFDGSYEIEVPALTGYTVSAFAYDDDHFAPPPVYDIEVRENEDTQINLMFVNRRDPMEIPDPSLRAAIAEEMGKAAGDISYMDLCDLKKLNAPSRNIRDLSGLNYAERLETINLNDNQISDISALSGLYLSRLELAGNQIRDISSLPNIFWEGYVDLRRNYLDLSPNSEALFLINGLEGYERTIHYRPQSIREFRTVKTAGGTYTANLSFEDACADVEVLSDTEVTASIYLNRYDSYHIQKPLSAEEVGIYLHIGREGDLHGSTVTIKVSYDPQDLPAGMDETELRLKRFNESLKVWEELSPQGVNTVEKYIWAEVNDFSVFGLFENKPIVYGDVNYDSKIDVSDAIMVLRGIVGLYTLDGRQQVAADVSGNDDGIVNVADAILILRRIVGLIDKFPVEDIRH